ncbi:hypothetical protein HPB52_010843 [Rhipicephalus sanguineus]|uniref:Uncharacterized protein n=1 Tax=Rhipicephalus sanguineus TaxID=34632 RepID=A0A9D4Q660_RHISA|nr:hypothetical protein HPB52_010843 [Rhipicephalus sanguineus]
MHKLPLWSSCALRSVRITVRASFAPLQAHHGMTPIGYQSSCSFNCFRLFVTDSSSEQEELSEALLPTWKPAGMTQIDLLLRTIRLLVEVRQEQRQGCNSLSAQMRHLSTRLERIEGILEKRGQPVPPAAPIRDLPPLPATSLQELEAAEAALEDKDMAGALMPSPGRQG